MRITLLFILLYLLIGCDNPFVNDLDYISVTEDPELIVDCHYNHPDSIFSLRLSITNSEIVPQKVNPLNTEISLDVNGEESNDFVYDESIDAFQLNIDNLNLIQSTFNIGCTVDLFESIFTTQVMPNTPVLKSIDYVIEGYTNLLLDEYDVLNVHFEDDINTENYYSCSISHTAERIRIIQYNDGSPPVRDTFIDNWEDNLIPISPNSLKGGLNHYLIFNDKTFTQTNNQISFGFRFPRNPEGEINTIETKLTFSAITEDRYNYLRTFATYFNNEGNPFAEPTSLHQNIENGLGAFTLSNSISQIIK